MGAIESLGFHPAADLFPLMNAAQFEELKQNLAMQGLLEPITLAEGMILDGRNRYRACLDLEIEPRFRDFAGGDPYQWVWSLNGSRRDLTDDQRYLIWILTNEKSAEWVAEQDRIKEEGNRKRAEAAGQGRVGRAAAKRKTEEGEFSGGAQCPPTKPSERKGRLAKAESAGVNTGAVKRMDTLRRSRPDLAEQVRTGRLGTREAWRQMLKDSVQEKVKALPAGQFRVIYADPPWQYNDTRQTNDHRESTGAQHHYATLSLAELKALAVKDLAAPDAVLFCWATFPLLPDALEVVKAWGFEYKTAFIWDKGSGAFGHYHNAAAEMLLVAVRGSCTPDHERREDQVQAFPREGHSRKPDAWRQLIDRIYPQGPRIELFCRGGADSGWAAWGAEAEDAA